MLYPSHPSLELTGSVGAGSPIAYPVERTKTVENGGTTRWQEASRRGSGRRVRINCFREGCNSTAKSMVQQIEVHTRTDYYQQVDSGRKLCRKSQRRPWVLQCITTSSLTNPQSARSGGSSHSIRILIEANGATWMSVTAISQTIPYFPLLTRTA